MPELRESDLKEERKIQQFAHNGCKCTKGPGNTPCCQQFREDHYREMRGQCTELSHEEKDLVIKAQLIASTNCDETTKHESVYRHNHSQPREREYTTYRHCGLPVCRETFLFLHCLGSRAFKNIRRSCKEDGLTPRVHGNKHRLPTNALTFDETTRVVTFLQNYAEEHAIQLPGRIPGYKRTDLQLLPCHTTKTLVWKTYSSVGSQQAGARSLAYSTFCQIWQKLLPNILPTRPMTDLCAECHKNAALIQRNSNLSEEEKSEVIVVNNK